MSAAHHIERHQHLTDDRGADTVRRNEHDGTWMNWKRHSISSGGADRISHTSAVAGRGKDNAASLPDFQMPPSGRIRRRIKSSPEVRSQGGRSQKSEVRSQSQKSSQKGKTIPVPYRLMETTGDNRKKTAGRTVSPVRSGWPAHCRTGRPAPRDHLLISPPSIKVVAVGCRMDGGAAQPTAISRGMNVGRHRPARGAEHHHQGQDTTIASTCTRHLLTARADLRKNPFRDARLVRSCWLAPAGVGKTRQDPATAELLYGGRRPPDHHQYDRIQEPAPSRG